MSIISRIAFYLTMRNMSFFIIIAYTLKYFSLDSTPGNSPFDHPEGWWGWFDQGKYLLSANAIYNGDFTPDKHYYPPLYPLIGAFFLIFSTGHLYFLINILCLLWFGFVFVKFTQNYISKKTSIVIFLLTSIINQHILENYTIPWTSTLSSALLASGLFTLIHLKSNKTSPDFRIVIFGVVCLSLIIPTRPVDTIAAFLFGIAILFLLYRHRESPYNLKIELPILIIASCIGPIIFITFNLLIFNNIIGGYLIYNSGNGFYFADIPEKFISIFINSYSLYGEKTAALFKNIYWLPFSLVCIIWALFYKDILIKTLALSITLHYLIYIFTGKIIFLN